MTIEVLDPTGRPTAAATFTRAPRPASLDGARLGVLDNGKPNSDRFLTMLSGLLVGSTGIATVDTVRKPAIGRLAPPEQHDRLVASVDVVVTGVGDCSGCATCTVHDALDLEAAGIPTAIVCTDEFLDLVRRHASLAGARVHRFVAIEHPLGTRSMDELEALATATVDGVVAWLTGAELPDPSDVPARPAGTTSPGAGPGPEVTCLC